MNTPKEQKKQQITENFYLLCDAFLSSQAKTNIKIIFQEQELEGKTFFNFKEKSFVVSFWNQEYKSHDFLLEVVAHEFTHVVFFLNQGKHTHDWIFFVYVELFLFWLKANQKT